MIATTFRGESVYLLYQRPNWATAPVVRFTSMGDVARSLGGTEARHALAATFQVRFQFSLFLLGSESSEFRVALQRQSAQNRRILCPFWPGAVNYYTGGAVYTSPEGEFYTSPDGDVYTSSTGEGCWLPTGVWLTFEPDMSAWEIHETDTPSVITPTADAIRVPLMLGIFEEQPDPVAVTDRLLTVPIQFRETSPADMALRNVELAFDDGPAVASRTPKIFPLDANWAHPISAGGASTEILREDIGFSRGPAETYYPQASRRGLEMGFTATSWEEVARLIAFFFQRQGMVESFWIQGPCNELSLTATTSGASATIAVDDASALGDNRFLVFDDPSQAVVVRHVEDVDLEADQLTLDSAPGVFAPGSTRIVSLILARYARPDLTVTFLTDRVAESTIRFIETPQEYFIPSGETPGTTSGATPRQAWGFRLYQIFPEATKYWRFTSYEDDITASGETFLGNLNWSHDSITDDLDPSKCRVAITARSHEGNPLAMLLRPPLEADLYCDVVTLSPGADNVSPAAVTVFVGRVGKPSFRGPIISVEVRHLIEDLAQPVPTKLIQPTCNYRLYGESCGIDRAGFEFTGAYVDDDGNDLTIDTIARTIGSVPTLSDGYFARGRAWFGAGDAYQSRAIYRSLTPGAGQLTLTLSRPFDPIPTAETIYFEPGCDKRKDTCLAKFDNYARFGGYPYVPVGNPSLVAIKDDPPAAGKK